MYHNHSYSYFPFLLALCYLIKSYASFFPIDSLLTAFVTRRNILSRTIFAFLMLQFAIFFLFSLLLRFNFYFLSIVCFNKIFIDIENDIDLLKNVHNNKKWNSREKRNIKEWISTFFYFGSLPDCMNNRNTQKKTGKKEKLLLLFTKNCNWGLNSWLKGCRWSAFWLFSMQFVFLGLHQSSYWIKSPSSDVLISLRLYAW